MKKQNNKLKILLYILGIWWAIASLLGAIQLIATYRAFWPVPLGIIAAIAVFYLHMLLYKKTIQNKKSAVVILYLYAAAHFIPLAMQFIGIKSSGMDNVVSALIGFSLFYLYEN